MSGRTLPKFGEWDLNDPSSAEGFTVIFNKARDEKKGVPEDQGPSRSEGQKHSSFHSQTDSTKQSNKRWFCCCFQSGAGESS